MSKIYVDEIAGIASPSTVAIPGHVIQAVSATTANRYGTSSTSFVTTLGAAITPSSTSSKVLVMIQSCYSTEAPSRTQYITLFRDSTNLGGTDGMIQNLNGPNGDYQRSGVTLNFLDSPNTTSPVTYYLAHKSGGGNVEIVPFNNALSSVILLEIAG